MKQKTLHINKSELTKDEQKEQDTSSDVLLSIVEAALFAASEPLSVRKLIALFPDAAQPSTVEIQNTLLQLQAHYQDRGVELQQISKRWRFQTKEKYSPWLQKLTVQKPPKFTRAQLETLAIIAYQQPVTRADIEQVRGVSVSSDILRMLEEREWVQQVGFREVPGRPALFATTIQFLSYFNLSSLTELPELLEPRALGDVAKDMNLTLSMDGVKTQEETQPHEENTSATDEIH